MIELNTQPQQTTHANLWAMNEQLEWWRQTMLLPTTAAERDKGTRWDERVSRNDMRRIMLCEWAATTEDEITMRYNNEIDDWFASYKLRRAMTSEALWPVLVRPIICHHRRRRRRCRRVCRGFVHRLMNIVSAIKREREEERERERE